MDNYFEKKVNRSLAGINISGKPVEDKTTITDRILVEKIVAPAGININCKEDQERSSA